MENENDILKEFPNIDNNNYPGFVRCSFHNMAHITGAFMKCCHQSLYIHEVEFYRASNPPYCRWFVKYRKRGNKSLPKGLELKRFFRKILGIRPFNVTALHRFKEDDDKTAVIQYGVHNCDCRNQNFGKAIHQSRSYQYKIDELQVQNLKLEENNCN